MRLSHRRRRSSAWVAGATAGAGPAGRTRGPRAASPRPCPGRAPPRPPPSPRARRRRATRRPPPAPTPSPTAAPWPRSASAAAASSRPPCPRRPQRGSTSSVLTSAIAGAVLAAVVARPRRSRRSTRPRSATNTWYPPPAPTAARQASRAAGVAELRERLGRDEVRVGGPPGVGLDADEGVDVGVDGAAHGGEGHGPCYRVRADGPAHWPAAEESRCDGDVVEMVTGSSSIAAPCRGSPSAWCTCCGDRPTSPTATSSCRCRRCSPAASAS